MITCKRRANHHLDMALDEALDQGFPAGDPPSLTEPSGDVRDAVGYGCGAPAAEGHTRPVASGK